MGGDVGQGQRGAEEDHGGNAGRLGHEVRRAGGAEQAARSARAEGRAHVGALAVLQQYQADNGDSRNDLYYDNQIEEGTHVIPFKYKSFVSFCFYRF